MTNNSDRRSPGFWNNLFDSFRIAWRLLWDSRVPLSTKIIPVLVVLYVVSPIDIIPDWIPGLGQLDDLAILLLGVRFFIAMSPRDLVARFRAEINGDTPPGGWTVTGSQSNASNQDQRSSASKDVIDG